MINSATTPATCHYLTKRQLNDPHKVFIDFYHFFSPSRIKKFIDRWMKALYKEKSWTKSSPADFLFYYDQIIPLVEASYIISQSDHTKRASILNEDEHTHAQLMNPDLYCLSKNTNESWDYFPRSLTKKEFINPYRVINKFFKNYSLSNWRKKLHNILHIALSSDKLDESGDIVNVYEIKKHLDKLVDASHLIYVREYTFLDTTITSEEQ